MDKNLFLAVALSVGVYALWFGVIEKKVEPPAKPAAEAAISPEAAAPAEEASALATPIQAKRERVALSKPIKFGGALIRVASPGAGLVSYQYEDKTGPIELSENSPRLPGFLSTWPSAEFHPVKNDPFSYSARLPDGAAITKTFVPGTKKNLPELDIAISNPTGRAVESAPWTLSIGPGLNTVPDEQKENHKVWRALGLLEPKPGLNGKLEVFKKPQSSSEDFRWVGVDNRYFLAAVVPPAGCFGSVASGLPPEVTLNAPAALLAPHASKTWKIPFYIGPKGMIWLSHFHLGLERSISFGFFSTLGRAMMRALYWLNRFTGNWGWSIIVLTILIQLVLMPLSYKSYKSMTAMKKLQPEITRLQQIYAKDAKKLNEQTMAVYKKHGVHPASGCLPMLVQFPIFFALFYALRGAWELHGAGWIFWITDLSAKDPYYVLPLVMGAVMFFQNKLNPMSSDPMQAKMMTWMPIIFTFMFLYFPSGLVLYYLTSNLCTLITQAAFKKRLNARMA
ncbi:MAG TPA: YidC/Oxa1 family insertase periplasmic-domain containing protein [Elusimicrobiota bacterium]|nr:YidC/Oxa1 family insertase periplasmic-domain containing protein [Elusimicrobiota bacterium]